MAWTARFLDADRRDDRFVITIGYIDGQRRFSREYDVPLTNLPQNPDEYVRQLAIAEVARLVNADTVKPSFTLAKNQLLDLTPPAPPPPPTQAELDRTAWFRDWTTYQSYLKGIDANLPGMTLTAQQVVDLKASLDARFKPAYAGSL